jgi:BASS family bile acid:Na+ symporter
MSRITKTLLGLSIVFFLITICLFFIGQVNETGPFLILFFLFLALGIRGTDRFKGLSFTVLIFAAVSLSMYYPQSFVQVGDFDKDTKLAINLTNN